MVDRSLSYSKTGHLAIIEIGGSSENEGTTARLSADFAGLCAEVAWDEETRVVVLSYDGQFFSPDGAPDQYAQRHLPSVVEQVAGLKQPVIAAVRGNGVGLGLELALACDVRIGTEDACYGFPQIREGWIPFAGGTQRLPRLVGQGRALEMILTGRLIDAGEARRMGLVNRVVAPDELMGAAMGLAQEMASRSPLALGFVKEALYDGMDMTLDQGLRMELDLYLLLFTTRDRVEGVTAFKEEREPKFEGT
jgi:enoyl-CoA hydratase/carnithine racemase